MDNWTTDYRTTDHGQEAKRKETMGQLTTGGRKQYVFSELRDLCGFAARPME